MYASKFFDGMRQDDPAPAEYSSPASAPIAAPVSGGSGGGSVAPRISAGSAGGVLNTGDFILAAPADLTKPVQFPNYLVPAGALVEVRAIGTKTVRIHNWLPVLRGGGGSFVLPGDSPRAFPCVNLAEYWALFQDAADVLTISVRQR